MRIVFALFLIIALIFLGLKFVPVYYGNYAFKDYVDDESRRASYAATTADTVRDEVFRKAQDLEIPLTKDQIHVEKGGGGAPGLYPVTINADYTVHVDLLVTGTDLHFAIGSQVKSM